MSVELCRFDLCNEKPDVGLQDLEQALGGDEWLDNTLFIVRKFMPHAMTLMCARILDIPDDVTEHVIGLCRVDGRESCLGTPNFHDFVHKGVTGGTWKQKFYSAWVDPKCAAFLEDREAFVDGTRILLASAFTHEIQKETAVRTGCRPCVITCNMRLSWDVMMRMYSVRIKADWYVGQYTESTLAMSSALREQEAQRQLPSEIDALTITGETATSQ